MERIESEGVLGEHVQKAGATLSTGGEADGPVDQSDTAGDRTRSRCSVTILAPLVSLTAALHQWRALRWRSSRTTGGAAAMNIPARCRAGPSLDRRHEDACDPLFFEQPQLAVLAFR